MHQENAKQNHNKASRHIQNGYNRKKIHNKYWQTCGETGDLRHCWWESKWWSHFRKQLAWQYLKRLSRKLPYDPEIPLGLYLRELKT